MSTNEDRNRALLMDLAKALDVDLTFPKTAVADPGGKATASTSDGSLVAEVVDSGASSSVYITAKDRRRIIVGCVPLGYGGFPDSRYSVEYLTTNPPGRMELVICDSGVRQLTQRA